MKIVEMKIGHYNDVLELWRCCEGVGLDNKTDTKNKTAVYLARNRGLSYVALEKGDVIGAVLCGHDGRRGYLYHLAVAKEFRGWGIGHKLAEKALAKLRSLGIRKCHAFVFTDNAGGNKFWESIGWTKRNDLKVISKDIF
jgi:ribosomal protein S18 acetylase RimI-like enzyme